MQGKIERNNKNMKTIIYMLCALVCISCSTKNNQKNIVETIISGNQINMDLDNEKNEIELLIRNLYKWVDNSDIPILEHSPVQDENDSIYICLDSIRSAKDVKMLNTSGLFAIEFVDNWIKTTNCINEKLRSNEEEWLVGEISPFGNNANPWCDCQDTPSDTFWDYMIFDFSVIDNDKATLSWTWDNSELSKSFSYIIRVVKEDGVWKVAYMQGFDINNYCK